MNKITIALPAALFLLMSCSNNNNLVQFRAINKSLQNANLLTENDNKRIYDELKQKLYDPQTRAKAAFWEPKAAEVKKLSSDIRGFVERLTTDLKKVAGDDEINKKSVESLFKNQEKSVELYQKILAFKKSLIALVKPGEFPDNPMLQKNIISKTNEFNKTLFADIQGDAEINKNAMAEKTTSFINYFENASVIGALAMLSKIESDILVAENTIVTYFDSMTRSNIHSYDKFSAILTQNSSYLKPGEPHEIYAGVGAFSLAADPKITINGVLVKPNENGVSIYSSKAGLKPGKYSIAVKFEFIKPDGSPFSTTEHIGYTVRD